MLLFSHHPYPQQFQDRIAPSSDHSLLCQSHINAHPFLPAHITPICSISVTSAKYTHRSLVVVELIVISCRLQRKNKSRRVFGSMLVGHQQPTTKTEKSPADLFNSIIRERQALVVKHQHNAMCFDTCDDSWVMMHPAKQQILPSTISLCIQCLSSRYNTVNTVSC